MNKTQSFFRRIFSLLCLSHVSCALAEAPLESNVPKPHFYDLTVRDIHGSEVPLRSYEGKVILVVNTASKCGFASQLRDLETLHTEYGPRGLVVLGFPSNDFLGQEPLSNDEIQKVCSNEYGVTFPLFEKNPVTGSEIQPLFKLLTQQSGEEFNSSVKWNYEKFLLDRNGLLRYRHRSFTNPASETVKKEIEELLG